MAKRKKRTINEGVSAGAYTKGLEPTGNEEEPTGNEEEPTSKKVKNKKKSGNSGKKGHAGGGSALAMAKAGKLYPVLDSVQTNKKGKLEVSDPQDATGETLSRTKKKKKTKKQKGRKPASFLNTGEGKVEEGAFPLVADLKVQEYQKKEAEKKKREDKKKNGLAKESHHKGKKKKSGKKGGPEFWKKNYPILDSTDNINKFIANVSQKNYAEANKYLQRAMEDKMRNRIASVTQDN